MRRVLLGAAGLALLAALAAGAVWGPGLQRAAVVGTGYVAKQMCSCLFVAGRAFEDCRPDMLPAMDRVRAEVLPPGEGPGVRASVPLLAARTARHREGFGCTLQP